MFYVFKNRKTGWYYSELGPDVLYAQNSSPKLGDTYSVHRYVIESFMSPKARAKFQDEYEPELMSLN